jgi:hypothetical protein
LVSGLPIFETRRLGWCDVRKLPTRRAIMPSSRW